MKIDSTIPDVPVQQFADGEIKQISLREFSLGKRVVLVSVPGAFTPACSDDHVPGFLNSVKAFQDMNVDAIVILATSDFFVVKAWADSYGAPSFVQFMADGSQKFADAADLIWDLTDLGLGRRSQRYVAVVEDGVVKRLFKEPDSGAVTTSSAKAVLSQL